MTAPTTTRVQSFNQSASLNLNTSNPEGKLNDKKVSNLTKKMLSFAEKSKAAMISAKVSICTKLLNFAEKSKTTMIAAKVSLCNFAEKNEAEIKTVVIYATIATTIATSLAAYAVLFALFPVPMFCVSVGLAGMGLLMIESRNGNEDTQYHGGWAMGAYDRANGFG